MTAIAHRCTPGERSGHCSDRREFRPRRSRPPHNHRDPRPEGVPAPAGAGRRTTTRSATGGSAGPRRSRPPHNHRDPRPEGVPAPAGADRRTTTEIRDRGRCRPPPEPAAGLVNPRPSRHLQQPTPTPSPRNTPSRCTPSRTAPSATPRATWSPTSRATSPPGATGCRPSAAAPGGAGPDRARVGHPRRGRGGRARRPEGPGARAALPRTSSASGSPAWSRSPATTRAPPRHTLAAMRAGAPVIYQAAPRLRRLAGLPRLPLPLPRQRLPLRRLPLHPLGHQARPLRQALLPGPALRLRRHARGHPGLPPRRARLRARPGRRAAVRRPGDFFYYYRQLRRSFLAFQAGWSADACPIPASTASWGRWAGAAEQLLAESRPPEPGRRHHPRPGAPAGGGGHHDAHRAGRVRAGAARARGCPTPVFERLRAQARLQLDSHGQPHAALASSRPPVPDEPRRGLALLPPPSRRRRLLRHGRVPLRRGRARVPVRRGDRGRARSRVPRLVGARRRRGARGLRGVHRLGRGALAAGSRRSTSTTTPRYEDSRRQAADGQVRHPRGRGGRPAPRTACSWTSTPSCGRAS